MSNRLSICWKCVHHKDCVMFNADPQKITAECGRFLMDDADKALYEHIYNHFFNNRRYEPQESGGIRNEQTKADTGI